jgi:hypothetical protein
MDALTLLKNPMTAMPDQTPSVQAVRARPSAGNGKGTSQIVVGRYKITEKGVFLVTPGDDDKPDKFEFVCGKLDVVAMIRDQHSGQWGKLLQWQDPDGQFHEWAMPMAALQGDGAEVRRNWLRVVWRSRKVSSCATPWSATSAKPEPHCARAAWTGLVGSDVTMAMYLF